MVATNLFWKNSETESQRHHCKYLDVEFAAVVILSTEVHVTNYQAER
jgi:hypothetical protein